MRETQINKVADISAVLQKTIGTFKSLAARVSEYIEELISRYTSTLTIVKI